MTGLGWISLEAAFSTKNWGWMSWACQSLLISTRGSSILSEIVIGARVRRLAALISSPSKYVAKLSMKMPTYLDLHAEVPPCPVGKT